MGLRSDWLYRIAAHTGARIYDIPTLMAYLLSRGVRAKAGRLEDLEAIASHLGVPGSKDTPMRLIPPPKNKKRSVISDQEIVNLRSQGLSKAQIARMAGITRQAVGEKLHIASLQAVHLRLK